MSLILNSYKGVLPRISQNVYFELRKDYIEIQQGYLGSYFLTKRGISFLSMELQNSF